MRLCEGGEGRRGRGRGGEMSPAAVSMLEEMANEYHCEIKDREECINI